MAFARPTMPELLERVRGDIASRTEGLPFIRRAVERPLGYAVAGVAYLLHAHVAWVRDQLFPQSAEREALIEWGDWLETPIKAGARAQGRVAFAGANAAAVPLGTLVQDSEGRLYRVGAAVGGGVYEVEAVELGAAQNLALGEPLALVSPLGGVESNASVQAALSGGSDEEETEAYRARVLDALRAPALSGAPGDYRRWALTREGVTRAWEHDRRMGAGTVSLGFVFDGRSNIIPTPDDVAAMQAYLDSVRPADMLAVYVVAPVPNALRIAVTARGTMTEAEMRSAVEAMLKTDAELEQPLAMSQLDEALSTTPGELSHAITSLQIVERGVVRTVPAGSAQITPGSWGLLTLDTLTLTVVT